MFLFFITGCSSPDQKVQDHQPRHTRTLQDTCQFTNVSDGLKSPQTKVVETECEPIHYTRNYSTDIGFQKSKHFESKNERLFQKWSQDSLINIVTSITFRGYDTIPKKYAVFRKVQRISIDSRRNIYRLDLFPKLRTIHFFASEINLDTDENWPSRIEVLIAQKTKITGWKSFLKTPNLKVLYLAFSGFDSFPTDLESVSGLQELTLGAYTFKELDLSTLDLSQNRCLKKVTFQTWYNNLSGIPKGLFSSNIKELEISHQKLTSSDKQMLKQLRDKY